MRGPLLLAVSAIAFVGAGAPAAWAEMAPIESATAEDQAPPAPAATRRPFTLASPPCGSAGNSFYCVSVAPNGRRKTVSTLRVALPGKGKAVVTWNGSIFCDVRGANDTPVVKGYSYFVHMALKNDISPIVYNEPGSASFGESLGIEANHRQRVMMTPVSLTKLFPVARRMTMDFRVFAEPDFRVVGSSGPSYCNLNGGVLLVQYFLN